MASRQGSSAKGAAAADLDPVHEWHDTNGSYLLRLNLPGFKKEDFQVHVDPTGRLTILGTRSADGGDGDVRLHKAFQLPSTANLDGITGRYDGTMLSLTVPKLPHGAVSPPQAKEEVTHEDAADKPTDQKSKIGREAERWIEEAKARLPGRKRDEQTAGRSKKPPPATKADERREQPRTEATTATATPSEKAAKWEDDRAKAEAEHKAKVEREAEQRIEAAKARLAAEREAESEKKRCWKERAAEEGFKWAEAVGKNKEVIAATAVAAFTLGVFVSHRLFSRS